MPKEPKSYAPRIPSSAWEQHQCRIRKLYVDEDHSLNDVVEIMKKSGFHASVSQYERQLKSWGIRKNRTRDEWRLIKRVVDERRLQGRDSAVLIDGVVQPSDRLERELARSEYHRYEGLKSGLPDYIQVRSPAPAAPTTETSANLLGYSEIEVPPPALRDSCWDWNCLTRIWERPPPVSALEILGFWTSLIQYFGHEIRKRWRSETWSCRVSGPEQCDSHFADEPSGEDTCEGTPDHGSSRDRDVCDRSPSPPGSWGIPSWESVGVTSEEWVTRGWNVFFGAWDVD